MVLSSTIHYLCHLDGAPGANRVHNPRQMLAGTWWLCNSGFTRPVLEPAGSPTRQPGSPTLLPKPVARLENWRRGGISDGRREELAVVLAVKENDRLQATWAAYALPSFGALQAARAMSYRCIRHHSRGPCITATG